MASSRGEEIESLVNAIERDLKINENLVASHNSSNSRQRQTQYGAKSQQGGDGNAMGFVSGAISKIKRRPGLTIAVSLAIALAITAAFVITQTNHKNREEDEEEGENDD